MISSNIPKGASDILHKAAVIPALPLVLNYKRNQDECRQSTLARYYLYSVAGGIVIGEHTIHLEIRLSEVALYDPVMQITEEGFEISSYRREKHRLE